MKSLFILALCSAGAIFANEAQDVAQNNPAPVKKVLPQDEVVEEISQEGETEQAVQE